MHNWKFATISEIAHVKGGRRLPKGHDYSDSVTKHPYIRVSDFTNQSIKQQDLRYISTLTHESIKKYTISHNDIYISIAGTIGLVGRVPISLSGANLTENAAKIVIHDRNFVDPDYLVWFLSTEGQIQIDEQTRSTSQPKLALFRIGELSVPIPPLKEQRRIAAILDKADELRRKRQESLALMDEFLRSVFLDMFGDPVTNPKGWEKTTLKTLITPDEDICYGVVQPGKDTDQGVGLVRVQNLVDGYIKQSELRKVSSNIDEKHHRSRLRGGEILISCVGTIGRVAMATKADLDLNIARAIIKVPLRDDVPPEYMLMFLQQPAVQGYFKGETRTVSQPTLNVGLLKETPVLLPNSEQLSEFRNIWNSIQMLKNKLISSQNCLALSFKSLTQRAFRGELTGVEA